MSKRILALVVLALAAAAVTAISLNGGDAQARTQDSKLTLVAYSTPREAYAKIIPEFQKTAKGNDVSFEQSYGSSGEQARAVRSGLKADIVALSLEPDITTLVKAGLVNAKWKQNEWNGMVTRSVVVFAVREGNPKKIKDWEDLVRKDVDVVTPNVQTSGGAKWNVMAAYGAMRKKGRTHKQAVAYLRNLYKHIVSQDKSARESLQTFLAGRGDVLLAYENEALFANSKGQDVPYIIPKATIRIENPVAILKTSKNKAVAGAFLNFLRSAKAQQIYGQNGYRPLVPSVLKQFKYPVRQWLFTIKSLGGWAKVDKQFFDPNTGIVTKIQKETG
jgi:sulfate/thiosulfate transport system substrate-binding protein